MCKQKLQMQVFCIL